MNTSKTGVSGLSCKLLAILLFVFSIGSFAADNSIYIDQSGDNASVTITQDGAGNVVRGIQGVGSSNTTPEIGRAHV